MLPFKALALATDAGPGQIRDMETTRRRFTVIVSVFGGPTGGTVYLEGAHSLDDSVWVRLAPVAITSGVSQFVVTTTENEHDVRYVRCYLDGLTGGSVPRVTAYVVGADS